MELYLCFLPRGFEAATAAAPESAAVAGLNFISLFATAIRLCPKDTTRAGVLLGKIHNLT